MRMLALLLIPALLAADAPRPRVQRRSRLVSTAREAKAISEAATGGKAVSARPVPLNGATGGWEVDVHMPKEARGWRCIVDNDSHMVFTKDRIPNPPPPKGR